MIQAVGFDLDDTLYSRLALYERTFAIMEKQVIATGIPFATFESVFEAYSQAEFKLYNQGEKSREQYAADRVIRAYAYFGYTLTYNQGMYFNAVYHAEQRYLTLRDGIEACLQTLISKGIKPFLLTNGSSEGQWKKIQQLELEKYFPHENIFVSGEFPWAKPDSQIFTHISDRLGISPEMMVYFGDNPIADAQGAYDAGYQGAWYDLDGLATGKEPYLSFQTIADFQQWLEVNS